MKKTATTILILLLQLCCQAQYSTLYNSGHKLNSTLRADMGAGVCRTCFNVFVPANTVQLIIATSTSKKAVPASIQLTAQIADYYSMGGAPIVQNIINSIVGAGQECSISLYGYHIPGCAQAFINNAARQCRAMYAQENTTGGASYIVGQQLEMIRNKYCSFCIYNNESTSATYLNIEITAVADIPEPTATPDYTEPAEQPIYTPPAHSFDKDKYKNIGQKPVKLINYRQ